MRRALIPHPDTPCDAVERLEAEAVRTAGGLELRYVLTGDLARLKIPAPAAPERTDELWRHTCFEAFVAGDGEGYCELNLSPSTQWAASRFDGYRTAMAPLEIAEPAIEVRREDRRLALRATVAVAAGRLALTAVVEEAGGRISYWSLAHPPGRPDFHHPDCLALEFPERP